MSRIRTGSCAAAGPVNVFAGGVQHDPEGYADSIEQVASQACHSRHRKSNSCTEAEVPNAELRTREYLTDAEVGGLIEAAKGNRYDSGTQP
jgi:hypothetical protein